MMLIELIGPAGIGKTTTAKGAEAILREKGVDVLGFDELERLESEIGTRSVRRYGRWGRAWFVISMLCRRPDITLPVLLLPHIYGAEVSTGSRGRRRRRARRVLGHVRLALSLRHMPSDRVALLDEGFTQVLWTLLIDSRSLRASWLVRFVLKRYHAAVGQAGVCFDADDTTIERRAFAREANSRFSRDSTAEPDPRAADESRASVQMRGAAPPYCPG
ncbi:MAG: hypothetical protein AAGC99_12190 [Pseudomonadota bacterium]